MHSLQLYVTSLKIFLRCLLVRWCEKVENHWFKQPYPILPWKN